MKTVEIFVFKITKEFMLFPDSVPKLRSKIKEVLENKKIALLNFYGVHGGACLSEWYSLLVPLIEEFGIDEIVDNVQYFEMPLYDDREIQHVLRAHGGIVGKGNPKINAITIRLPRIHFQPYRHIAYQKTKMFPLIVRPFLSAAASVALLWITL